VRSSASSGGELPGRVGLGAGEQEHSHPTRSREQVLGLGWVGAPRLEALAHAPFLVLVLGLGQVLAINARELLVARDLRRRSELLERLFLDRVGVRQILGELFGEGMWHRFLLPVGHA
jgi:hypothetical protein